jgi:hypothetical protein
MNKLDVAFKYFRAGIEMASKEEYNHNLIALNNVLKNNNSLRAMDYDVINGGWGQ